MHSKDSAEIHDSNALLGVFSGENQKVVNDHASDSTVHKDDGREIKQDPQ